MFWEEWRAEFGHNSRWCWTIPQQDQATDQTRWWVVVICLRTVNVAVVYFVVHDDPRQTLSGRLAMTCSCADVAERRHAQWRACSGTLNGEGDRKGPRQTDRPLLCPPIKCLGFLLWRKWQYFLFALQWPKARAVLRTGTFCPTRGRSEWNLWGLDYLISWLDNQKNSN